MILVVGSLNMDLVVSVPRFPAPGETLLGDDFARHPGGKGANQAVAPGDLDPRAFEDADVVLLQLDVLVVNETEAGTLTGLDADEVARDPERALAALIGRVPAAVVTLGASGAAWRDADEVGRVIGHAVDAVAAAGRRHRGVARPARLA